MSNYKSKGINRMNNKMIYRFFVIIVLLLAVFPNSTFAQFELRWMTAGALHDFYGANGCETEAQNVSGSQQDGFQWPAIMQHQDMKAARGLWIGAKNFTDEKGEFYSFKVVTNGPRNPGFWPVFPETFRMVSKFEPTVVSVDGNLSFQKDVIIDEIDPALPADRMLEAVVNTQLGITFTRRIYQWSQQFNDNYMIYEYVFKNTGNVDADPEIELPNQSLEDVNVYFSYRNAVNKQVRYVIGNSTGWGKNTLNDTRGDGVKIDPPEERFRAQYCWHGYTAEKEVGYDNIGAPILNINSTAAPFNDPADTIGRLGGTQFMGVVTIHADKSTADPADDLRQPTTTTYENSDAPLFLAGANAFNKDKMATEYAFMTKGNMSPRHADLVEPSGDYAVQKTNPNLGNSGGFSFNNGYGLYNMAPGDSFRIVMAEGAAGMSYEEQIRVGRLFKAGQMTPEAKNREVMKGRDSIFQTFRRAIENYQAGFSIPLPPMPPKTFDVNSGGDRISLVWTVDESDPNPPTSFQIYRALGNYYAPYEMIAEVDPSARSYDDKDVIRGFSYFYYFVAVGSGQSGGPATPAGRLHSGRYYTQTYDPATLQRQAGERLSDIRIVPNPYNISAKGSVRFPGTIDEDKLAFYNIPGECTIQIYTELGELIKTIEHTNGSGDEYWYSVTSSNQLIVSGIYVALIRDHKTGEKHIAKFVIIR
jgi:hypothetical protein